MWVQSTETLWVQDCVAELFFLRDPLLRPPVLGVLGKVCSPIDRLFLHLVLQSFSHNKFGLLKGLKRYLSLAPVSQAELVRLKWCYSKIGIVNTISVQVPNKLSAFDKYLTYACSTDIPDDQCLESLLVSASLKDKEVNEVILLVESNLSDILLSRQLIVLSLGILSKIQKTISSSIVYARLKSSFSVTSMNPVVLPNTLEVFLTPSKLINSFPVQIREAFHGELVTELSFLNSFGFQVFTALDTYMDHGTGTLFDITFLLRNFFIRYYRLINKFLDKGSAASLKKFLYKSIQNLNPEYLYKGSADITSVLFYKGMLFSLPYRFIIYYILGDKSTTSKNLIQVCNLLVSLRQLFDETKDYFEDSASGTKNILGLKFPARDYPGYWVDVVPYSIRLSNSYIRKIEELLLMVEEDCGFSIKYFRNEIHRYGTLAKSITEDLKIYKEISQVNLHQP